MIFVGIDPGLTGAVAFLPSQQVYDTPTAEVKAGKKKRNVYLPQEMTRILRVRPGGDDEIVCHLERQQAMPKQGVSSTFKIGQGFGLWEGILAALGIRYEIVGPQVWQKEMLGSVRGKDAARVRAQRLFPELTEQLAPKTKHGRSDALLIAEFARRTYGRE